MGIVCTEGSRIHLAHHLTVTHHDTAVDLRTRIGQQRIEQRRHLLRTQAYSLGRCTRQVIDLCLQRETGNE